MRVGVHDVGLRQPRIGEGELDGPLGPGAHRVGLGDVVPVRGDAGPGHHPVDPGAAGFRVLPGFQDEHARALAEDEAVPALVVRAGGTVGLVVALGERHHRRERRHGEGVDARLGATGDHDVGPPGPDHVDGVRHGLGARRTGGDGGVHAGPGLELDADVPGRAVRHQRRDGVRGDPPRPLLAHGVPGVEQADGAADPGGDHHAEAQRIDLRGPGVGPRFPGRDEGELLAPVELARLDPVHHLERVDERGGREADGQLLRPRLGERPAPGRTGEHGGPGTGDVTADRRRHPQSGDHDVGVGVLAHAAALLAAALR